MEGARNGDVSVVVKAEEVGESPAVEDKHYIITSKSVRVKANEETSATLNIETKIVDDDEINTDRTFKLTIVSANGAKIGENASVLVTIRDNENAFYEQFFGTWTITAMCSADEENAPDEEFSNTIEITGETDEDALNYNKILTAKKSDFFKLHASYVTDFEWHFNYTFDESTKTGTLSFACGEVVGNLAGQLNFVWMTSRNGGLVSDPLTTTWSLVDDKFSNEVIFPENAVIYLYCPELGGYVKYLYNIKMTKKR